MGINALEVRESDFCTLIIPATLQNSLNSELYRVEVPQIQIRNVFVHYGWVYHESRLFLGNFL